MKHSIFYPKKNILKISAYIGILLSTFPFSLFSQIDSVACEAGKKDAELYVSGTNWFVTGLVLGPLGLLMANSAEAPKFTNFAGKSSEYIAAYTECYQKAARAKKSREALRGCVIVSGCLTLGLFTFAESGFDFDWDNGCHLDSSAPGCSNHNSSSRNNGCKNGGCSAGNSTNNSQHYLAATPINGKNRQAETIKFGGDFQYYHKRMAKQDTITGSFRIKNANHVIYTIKQPLQQTIEITATGITVFYPESEALYTLKGFHTSSILGSLTNALLKSPEEILSEAEFKVGNYEIRTDTLHTFWHLEHAKDAYYARLSNWNERPVSAFLSKASERGTIHYALDDYRKVGAAYLPGRIRKTYKSNEEILIITGLESDERAFSVSSR